MFVTLAKGISSPLSLFIVSWFHLHVFHWLGEEMQEAKSSKVPDHDWLYHVGSKEHSAFSVSINAHSNQGQLSIFSFEFTFWLFLNAGDGRQTCTTHVSDYDVSKSCS